MNQLEQMFPSLTLFSDLNWDAVTREYESRYIDVSFPEYLQQKALDGDCPPYLFELAYYELALFDARTTDEPFPHRPGVYLNPTALFLRLEFDVAKMLAAVAEGHAEVIERPHVLSLFRGRDDVVRTLEVSEEDLTLLQKLEDGPLPGPAAFDDAERPVFERLKRQGLILDLGPALT
jgi:hypothetical protein